MKKHHLRLIITKNNKSKTGESKVYSVPDMSKNPLVYASLSDIGLQRSVNQDSYGVFPKDSSEQWNSKGLLFIIADGIGGHFGGRTASEMAVNIVQQAYFADRTEEIPESLLKAFKSANTQIYQEVSCCDPIDKMGTTCSALVLVEGRGYIAHVGDSRIYHVTMSQIQQLTQDHTIIEEMIQNGALSEHEAQNHPERKVLSRALGIEPVVEVDIVENFLLKSEEYLVLSTDGLVKVSDEEIKDIVLSNPPQAACVSLIQLANDRGGGDNVTVQVIRIN